MTGPDRFHRTVCIIVFFPEIDCGNPDPIDHATHTETATVYDSESVYACDAGYDPTGEDTIKCLNTSNWSDTDFSCSREWWF